MHDGSVKTLEEVVDWYAKGGTPNPHLDEDVRNGRSPDNSHAPRVRATEQASAGGQPANDASDASARAA